MQDRPYGNQNENNTKHQAKAAVGRAIHLIFSSQVFVCHQKMIAAEVARVFVCKPRHKGYPLRSGHVVVQFDTSRAMLAKPSTNVRKLFVDRVRNRAFEQMGCGSRRASVRSGAAVCRGSARGEVTAQIGRSQDFRYVGFGASPASNDRPKRRALTRWRREMSAMTAR